MTGAVLERPSLFAERRVSDRGGAPGDPGTTLEELLTSALQQARTNGSTECPVCHGAMTSTRAGAREAATVAECGGCGSRLS